MKKTFVFFAALFAALISFTLTSCEGNEPEGIITLKMRNSDNGGTTIDLAYNCAIGITYSNNFRVGGYGDGKICDAGAKKIGAVKKVPTAGWVDELAVIPGHTYVIKCNSYYEPDAETKYYKLYVIDWINSASSGGIIGAEVKYCEWEPNN